MKLIAHLLNEDGIRKEQTLQEHCIETAEYAKECIGSVRLHNTVYLAGILHDMGKAKYEYIQYLEDANQGKTVIKGSVNHTFSGLIWILEKFHTGNVSKFEHMACEVIGFAVGSHHALFDCVDMEGKNGFAYRLEKDRQELGYDEAVKNYFEQVISEGEAAEYFHKSVGEIKEIFESAKSICNKRAQEVFFQISMLMRLTLSAVIYGDRRSTSEFMEQKRQGAGKEGTWEERRSYFEEKLKQLPASSEMDQVRNEISCQCLEAAGRPCGIYRLNVPTGGGKTLSALRYALGHAEKEDKKRIIFIIPLLSVLDQNVKVIREYLPDPAEVLEHHSNIVREENGKEELDQTEFVSESWNYPIVVSTMVQLLDILFSHRITMVARMQALCDSVLVIDEIQTLPKHITAMFNMAMNFLSRFCNTTIILSSATQPCFEEIKWPLRLSNLPDLVQLSSQQMRLFKRADIIDRTTTYGMATEECAAFCMGLLQEHASVLVICNTKTEAKQLFCRIRESEDSGEWDIYHLSTAMCQKNRMDILEEVQEKLKEVQKCVREKKETRKIICIATQLVEAGIDFSFEGVVRILAGIDNLSQAAGRCNRSNEYGHTGTVYLINLKNENLSMLHEIASAQNSTRKVLKVKEQFEDDSLIGDEATRKFYQYLYKEMEDELEYPIEYDRKREELAKLLGNKNRPGEINKKYVLHQPFRTVGENFKVFSERTIDILVPYREGQNVIEQLREMAESYVTIGKLKKLVQYAKPYTISIYEWQKEKLDQAGMLHTILEGKIYCLDQKAYDEKYGLTMIDEQPVENYIL